MAMVKGEIEYIDFELNKYLNDLKVVGTLSKLFSDSSIPFIQYRVAENLYCASFYAENISRDDASADAKYKGFGVGIKTFTEDNKATFQKIAEFDKQRKLYGTITGSKGKIEKIAELRNRRLITTMAIYNVNKLIYHCVVRNEQGFWLFEEKIHLINIPKIQITEEKGGVISFTDGLCEYKFYESKSTLLKRFVTNKYFANIGVMIIDDPIKELKNLEIDIHGTKAQMEEYIIVPLFSATKGGTVKRVEEHSGLNQWNAKARKDLKGVYHPRNEGEVYIPYPKELRERFEGFFPSRETPFNCKLPNGETLSMKICQEDGKAIMSNPNKALGEWLLRSVLKLPPKTLLTYDYLLAVGVDAVKFTKYGGIYKVDFTTVGEYDDFLAKTFNDVEID
jgi:hypothetical protein